MRRSRHPLILLLCTFALLLTALGGTGATRCGHAAPQEPEAHACCPKKQTAEPDRREGQDEACAGACCEQPDYVAIAGFEPAPVADAAVPAAAIAATLVVPKPRQPRTVPARGPPRRPPRPPQPAAWLSHRALLI